MRAGDPATGLQLGEEEGGQSGEVSRSSTHARQCVGHVSAIGASEQQCRRREVQVDEQIFLSLSALLTALSGLQNTVRCSCTPIMWRWL